MHIAILAPSDRSFIRDFLPNHPERSLPLGYPGAPFIGTIIAELLKQKGHRVTAVTTTPALDHDYGVKTFQHGAFSWIVVPERPQAFRLNGAKLGRIVDLFRHERAAMAAAVRTINPDFVHAHWSYEFAGAALKTGYPCLVTVHDDAWHVLRFVKDAYRLGRLLLSEYVMRRVRFASTVSPYMLPYVAGKCPRAKVVPNPISIKSTFAEVEAMVEAKCPGLSAPRLIMINNGWNDHKNGGAGLAAFKWMRAKMPGATLHLFGSGSQPGGPAALEAATMGLDQVFFHGVATHDVLLGQLEQAHLLVHPAREESFGVVLIEAMSSGVPAVGGLKSGAVPWVIGDPRLLVDIDQPAEIGAKIVALLSDPPLYRQIAMDGYNNVARRFSATAVVDEYVAYYREIAAAW